MGWKLDIYTFLTIYSRPANSFERKRKTCLNFYFWIISEVTGGIC